MNKRIRISGLNASTIDISEFPELQERMNIKTVWTLYDENEVIENAPFNPFTGNKVERAEDTVLEHNKGVFIEDYVHDWNIKGNEFHIYSRVVGSNKSIELIIELR